MNEGVNMSEIRSNKVALSRRGFLGAVGAAGIVATQAIGADAAYASQPTVKRTPSLARRLEREDKLLLNRSAMALGGNPTPPQDRIRDLELLAGTGAGWLRTSMKMPDIAPERGVYDFAATDLLVTEASSNGTNILAVLHRMPAWLSSGRYKSQPSNLLDLYDLAKTIVSRYRNQVSNWEMWNEPNGNFFFDATDDDYLDVMKTMSLAVTDVDPANWVVGPTSAGRLFYARKILTGNGGDYLDVFSTHAYERPGPATVDNLGNRLVTRRALLDEFGLDMPIWITEFGYSTGSGPKDVSEQLQADRITSYLDLAYSYGVENCTLFRIRDRDGSTFGLYHEDFTPKPSAAPVSDYFAGLSPITRAAPRQRTPKAVIATLDDYAYHYTLGGQFTLHGYVYNLGHHTTHSTPEFSVPSGVRVVSSDAPTGPIHEHSRVRFSVTLQTSLSTFDLGIADSHGQFDDRTITFTPA